MIEHPAPSELDAFLRGDLPPRRVAAVLAHLLTGCGRCRMQLAPFAEWLVDGMGKGEPPVPEAAIDAATSAAYDAAIDRAFTAARQLAGTLGADIGRGAPVPAYPTRVDGTLGRDATWPHCEQLLATSFAARHDDPAAMLRFARDAAACADGLSPQRYGAGQVQDFRARAWAELGNAYRVNDDLHQAEDAIRRAARHLAAGTGDDRLRARVLDLTASLSADQRRFAAAEALLAEVQVLHERHGDRHAAGRAMISRGIYAGYAERTEEAIRLLEAGLAAIDRELDPGLARSAIDGLVQAMIALHRFREARALLWQNRRLYTADGQRVNRLKVRWHEGEIAAGLGELGRAEAAFRQALAGFAAGNLRYKEALVRLDLAAVLVERGEPAEAIAHTDAALATFHALGIEREALGALALLAGAVEREQALTAPLLAVLRGTAAALKKGQ